MVPTPGQIATPTLVRTQPHVRSQSVSSSHTLVGTLEYGSRALRASPSMEQRASIAKPAPAVVKEEWRARTTSSIYSALPQSHMESPLHFVDTPDSEPRTVPMYLFFLGFACPILWIVGTFMMRLPHSERRGTLDPFVMTSLPAAEKANAEREVERLMRKWKVEMKWGKRCMWATILFVCLGLAAGMSAWGALIAKKG